MTMSGKWSPSNVPIELLLVGDGKPFEGDPICFITCAQRAMPVCTGDWWGVRRLGDCEFGFDNPQSPIQSLGVFTHPWTGQRLEVANAGHARFWIEFEFGKWLFPKMTDNFNVLRPRLLDASKTCFNTDLIQAGRATG